MTAPKSVRIVTTRGITYDFTLSEKSTFKKLSRKLVIKRPTSMRVTTPIGSALVEATVLRVEVDTTYVKEVREE